MRSAGLRGGPLKKVVSRVEKASAAGVSRAFWQRLSMVFLSILPAARLRASLQRHSRDFD